MCFGIGKFTSFFVHLTVCLIAPLICARIPPVASAEAPTMEVDVLVYGATPAGVCAAVAASREGASVAGGMGHGNQAAERSDVENAKRGVMGDEKYRLVTSGFAQRAQAFGPAHLLDVVETDDHEFEPVQEEERGKVPPESQRPCERDEVDGDQRRGGFW